MINGLEGVTTAYLEVRYHQCSKAAEPVRLYIPAGTMTPFAQTSFCTALYNPFEFQLY